MVYDESVGQYFQIGLVSGGVSNCGNTDIPDYYVRLDHPDVAGFIANPDAYRFSLGLVEMLPSESTVPIIQSEKKSKHFKFQVRHYLILRSVSFTKKIARKPSVVVSILNFLTLLNCNFQMICISLSFLNFYYNK